MARDYKREIADRIADAIENGSAPWVRPHVGFRDSGLGPINAATGNQYRGINRLLLSLDAGGGDPRFVTYKQAEAKGWQVRPGEKGMPVEVWKRFEKQEKDKDGNLLTHADGTPKMVESRFAKYYTVFNASQIDGIPPREPRQTHEVPIHEVGERLLVHGPGRVEIRHDDPDIPHYRPGADVVRMPSRETFRDAGHYYGTLAHEIAHSTGHASRMSREPIAGTHLELSTEDRAKEELRAEIASWMIADRTGLPHYPDNHAAYTASWAQAVRNDPKEIFRAAAEAEKIADHVIRTYDLPEIQHERSAPEQAKAVEAPFPVKEEAGKDRAAKLPAEQIVNAEIAKDKELTGKLVVADQRGIVIRTPDGALKTMPGKLANQKTAKGYQQAGMDVTAQLRQDGTVRVSRAREHAKAQQRQQGIAR